MLSSLFKIVTVAVFCFNMFSCSMSGKAKKSSAERVSIAVVGSIDTLTQRIISEVLKENKIVVVMAGSVVYDVVVNRGDVDRAKQILRSEPKLQGRWIKFNDEFTK